MKYFIGLDIGTSAIKGALVSETGEIAALSSGKFTYRTEGTFRFLKPEHFIDICFTVINTLADKLPQDGEIKAISSCCASGSLIFLGENDQPLSDIVGWQTSVDEEEFKTYYTDEECEEIYKAVGWPVINGFPIAYLPWLKKNNRTVLKSSKMICMAAEYLNLQLCGGFGISHSMGTPFYLMDQENGVYNTKLLNKLGIREEQLPPIYPKGTVLGHTNNKTAQQLKLPTGTAVVLGSFDHPSGATGAGVYEIGDMLLSCGTSWVELFPVESREKAIDTHLLVDRFMLEGAPYCVMSSLTSVSEKIDAYRMHYLGKISHREFDELILGSAFGCNGLEINLLSEDYPDLAGVSSCDIARAIIEASARLLKRNLDEAEAKGLPVNSIILIGGIANAPVCVQVIADTLERDLKVASGESAGAVGAAMLAGIGIEMYKNEKDAYLKMNFADKISIFTPSK